jgi:hypothetical protein
MPHIEGAAYQEPRGPGTRGNWLLQLTAKRLGFVSIDVRHIFFTDHGRPMEFPRGTGRDRSDFGQTLDARAAGRARSVCAEERVCFVRPCSTPSIDRPFRCQ